MTLPAYLARLRALAKQATPGPWRPDEIEDASDENPPMPGFVIPNGSRYPLRRDRDVALYDEALRREDIAYLAATELFLR